MKTLTEKIVDRLEAEAVKWSDKTAQCEALFMAAKIVAYEFEEEQRDQIANAYWDGSKPNPLHPYDYYKTTFNTQEK